MGRTGPNLGSHGRKELTHTGRSSWELTELTEFRERMRKKQMRWGMSSSPGKESPGSVVFRTSGKDSVTEGAWWGQGREHALERVGPGQD